MNVEGEAAGACVALGGMTLTIAVLIVAGCFLADYHHEAWKHWQATGDDYSVMEQVLRDVPIRWKRKP